MKNLLATVIFTTLCFYVFAQKPPIKFGEIPLEDLQMTGYDADTSAAAVILADYGEARISPFQGKMIFERHTRIKILKKDGTSWANVEVPLWRQTSARETISGLKAVTYNLENGKIVPTKMNSDNVFEEKFNKNVDLKKFTLTNVKEGSIIEYTYKVNSDFITQFPNWQFQYAIPSRLTEYRAYIPDFFIFEKYMKGYLAPGYETKNFQQGDYNEKMHRWTINNAPAFKAEPYMTCEEDYISKINFALAYINFPGQPSREIMGSWEKLVGSLMGSEAFGKTVSGNNFLKKKVEELTNGITEPEKKLAVIHNYVKNSLEWTKTSDALADDLKGVFEKKKGTAGDINLALASMLNKAGFSVDLLILSTRDHGFIRRPFPTSSQINYVVASVVIGEKRYYLDATEKYLPLNVLPERCLNGEGILISQDKTFKWVNLESGIKSKTIVSSDLVLSADGLLTGKLSFSRDGYDAHKMRSKYSSDGEEAYVKSFAGTQKEISSTKFENIDNLGGAVKESHELILNEMVNVAGDAMYLNPLIGYNFTDNPFKLSERIYPVDFGSPFEKVIIGKISVPDGYVIDELPKSKILALPNNMGKFMYNVTTVGNTINYTSSFSINKSLFVQADYPLLREFYTQVVAKQAEQIVLKRK
jgi:hypothetical protein